MGSAWGILTLLFAQEIDRPYISEEHEVKIQPPPGWHRREGQRPLVVKFVAPEELKPPAEIVVIHYLAPNPTPLVSFVSQARNFIRDKFKDSTITEDKEITVAGRPGHRFRFTRGNAVQIKTVVHRTNLEYYALDAAVGLGDAERLEPLIEKSVSTFEVVPLPLSSEERAAHARFLDLIKGLKADPSLAREEWHTQHAGSRRVGYQRTKIGEAEGRYVFEIKNVGDFGSEGKIDTLVCGVFSPDGRYQKIDTEQTKTHEKERWQFRASVLLQDGQAKVTRDMNGHKEEQKFKVEEGVFLDDAADIMRRVASKAAPHTYLLKVLSPYSNEWNVELLEVSPKESMELEGKRQEAIVVFSKADRRKNKAYYYGPDGRLARFGGPKDSFTMRESTETEATK